MSQRHYCPRSTPELKNALHRISLCGTECVAGCTEQEKARGLGIGVSTEAQVTCPSCLREMRVEDRRSEDHLVESGRNEEDTHAAE